MSKNINEIKKVCQFLSQILTRWQHDDDFYRIKSLLTELLNGSIDFYRFKEIFPRKLPKTCLEIMELHLNLIKEQFALGLLDIQFIFNSKESKNLKKNSELNNSHSFPVQSLPVIDVNNRKIHINLNHHSSSFVGNKNITSNTIIKPVSYYNDKMKTFNVPRQISFRKENPTSSKRLLSSDSSIPTDGPIIKIVSQNCDYYTEPKIIKTESFNPIISAKKKIIDISNQCDFHSELNALPSLQTFDLSDTPVSKPSNTHKECLLVNSTIASEDKIQFIVDETIKNIANSHGIFSIDYDNVIPYVQSMLDVFSEYLLVHAVYNAMVQEECKNTFKTDSVLYKEIDNVRVFHKTLKNTQQLIISNQEREEKEKKYLEKGKIADGMKRKEEMKVFLANSTVQKSNNILSNIFGNTRQVANVPVIPTFRVRKRITAKHFLLVLRQKEKLKNIKAYKLVVAAVNQ